MPTVASPFGKGANVPRNIWIAVIVLLLAAVAIPSVLFATQGHTGTEARINAYKHEDGRVEFGMQLREGDGWGERTLPRGRFLDDDSPSERWLNSTPISLPRFLEGYSPLIDSGVHKGISYKAEMLYGPFSDGTEGEVNTTISLIASSAANDSGRPTSATLEITCDSGALHHYQGDSEVAPRAAAMHRMPRFSALVRFEFPAPRALREEHGADTYAVLDNNGDSTIEHYDLYTSNGFAEIRYRYATHHTQSGDPLVRFAFRSADGILWPHYWSSSLSFDHAFLIDQVFGRASAGFQQFVVSVVGFVGESRTSAEVFEGTFELEGLQDVPVILNVWNCGRY